MSDIPLTPWIKHQPITQTTTSGADSQSYIMDDTVITMDGSALMGGPTTPIGSVSIPRIRPDKPRGR